MSHRLTVLGVVLGMYLCFGLIAHFLAFSDRPDLRWEIGWVPVLIAAVVSTPLILLMPIED